MHCGFSSLMRAAKTLAGADSPSAPLPRPRSRPLLQPQPFQCFASTISFSSLRKSAYASVSSSH